MNILNVVLIKSVDLQHLVTNVIQPATALMMQHVTQLMVCVLEAVLMDGLEIRVLSVL